MRRAGAVARARYVVGAVLVAALGGCAVDLMPSGPLLSNESAEDVQLHVLGTDRVETIRAEGGRYVDVDGCEGTGLRFEQGDEVLGEHEGGLCPGMSVTVARDGTVTVVDGDERSTLAPG